MTLLVALSKTAVREPRGSSLTISWLPSWENEDVTPLTEGSVRRAAHARVLLELRRTIGR